MKKHNNESLSLHQIIGTFYDLKKNLNIIFFLHGLYIFFTIKK